MLPALLTSIALSTLAPVADTPRVSVRSPGGKVRIELLLGLHGGREAVPLYRVFFLDRCLVELSALGIEAVGAPPLSGPVSLESVETRSLRTEYRQHPGKRLDVLDHGSEAVVTLLERKPPGRRWELALRAYDDGVAFRYRFPAQEGWERLVLSRELTEIVLPADAQAFALPLNGFTTSYEKLYQRKRVSELAREWLLGLPLLVECPGRGWAAITEARLEDYAGLYLAPRGDPAAALVARLSPLPGNPGVAVEASLPHASPWRVILLADDPGRFIESDLLLHLNEPCAIPDVSWIQPGKTTFPWWNGFHLEGVDFKPGLNTATMEHYIDFCAESGIPYHSLDGIDNVAWYGGPIVPYQGAGITEGLPGLDLQRVIRHARDKKVRLRLWMHWKAAEAHMDRAFPLYQEWGIEGVMIDFMDRDDQEMVRWQRKLLRKAAENRLTVTLHGVAKPTGLERTFPNLLSSEGVLNLEYDKWDPVGCPPEHEITVPFTRMLAGPLDFHQGSFRGVPVEEFRPRNEAPLVMGTPCRTLASYVVYQNHLPMAADFPSAYRGHPALPALVQVPTTWDDTRCIGGRVGEHVIIARRHGESWWVGAMNDRSPREVEAPLSFLGPGSWRAETWADDPRGAGGHRLSRRLEEVSSKNVLKIVLGPAGGQLIRLTPIEGQKLPGPSPKPHIVVFLSDDHSLLDSTVYGSRDVRTPNMERLASAGLTFDRAFVASPSCAPSRAALLTGLMPARNGAEANHSRPRAGIKKLPAYLKELGYEVVAFGKVSHYRHTADYGFDHFAHDGFHEDVAIPAGIRWLRGRKSDKPLCIIFGTNWPHVPWPETSEGYQPERLQVPASHVDTPPTREARARYYAAVTRMDRELGDVMDAANEVLGPNTFFLHTADHGAQWPFAKWSLYDAGIRTPLIVAWPGTVRAGARSEAMVSWIDILPTLVEIAGGPAPEGLDGRSFAGVLRGEEREHRDRIFTTHSSDGRFNIYPARSLRTGEWKYIRNLHPEFYYATHIDLVQGEGYFGSWLERARQDPAAAAVLRRYHQRPAEELYDLGADPLELMNLAGDPRHAARLAEMRGEVEAWMKANADEGKVHGTPRMLSDPRRAEPPPQARSKVKD